MAFPIGEIQRPNQLSQGGGFVTVTNLLAKIGGQVHYKSLLQVAFPTFAANTRYFVYAVLASPNNPILVISTNVNSVGPAGYSAWDLIGAFYSNGAASIGFGSFVNIIGTPRTFSQVPWDITFPGGVTYDQQDFRWEQNGGVMNITGQVRFTSIPAIDTRFTMPTNLVMDTARITTSRQNSLGTGRKLRGNGGAYSLGSLTDNFILNYTTAFGTTLMQFSGYGQGDASANIGQVGYDSQFQANDRFIIDNSQIPIVGWSTTQLKDL